MEWLRERLGRDGIYNELCVLAKQFEFIYMEPLNRVVTIRNTI